MKMKNIYKKKVAIFDVDGTLIDSKTKIIKDVINAFKRLGKSITPEQIRGNWYDLANKYKISNKNFDNALSQRKSWEQALKNGDAPIFPETHRVLDKLKKKGVRMSILSKSTPRYTNTKLDYFDLKKYFEQVITINPDSPNKTQGSIEVIEAMDPKTIQKAYFIGDKKEDVTIANDINEKYKLSTQGIYVNRQGETLEGFHNIRSLEGFLGLI